MLDFIFKNLTIDILALLEVEEAQVKIIKHSAQPQPACEHYQIEITTNDGPALIGLHGTRLTALTHILKIICQKKAREREARVRITVDVNGYLAQKEEELIELAERKAKQVQLTGKSCRLPSMPSYLRRKIHLKLRGEEWQDLITESSGTFDERAIMIKKRS